MLRLVIIQSKINMKNKKEEKLANKYIFISIIAFTIGSASNITSNFCNLIGIIIILINLLFVFKDFRNNKITNKELPIILFSHLFFIIFCIINYLGISIWKELFK